MIGIFAQGHLRAAFYEEVRSWRNFYSMVRVNDRYTGSCIRVRRSTDNVLRDIGFTANGTLNESDLLSFLGAASGFVHTWYDQVGSSDLIQAVNGNQPRIVNSGTVERVGNIAAPNFAIAGAAFAWLISSSFAAFSNESYVIGYRSGSDAATPFQCMFAKKNDAANGSTSAIKGFVSSPGSARDIGFNFRAIPSTISVSNNTNYVGESYATSSAVNNGTLRSIFNGSDRVNSTGVNYDSLAIGSQPIMIGHSVSGRFDGRPLFAAFAGSNRVANRNWFVPFLRSLHGL
jgi:hypothetical protein